MKTINVKNIKKIIITILIIIVISLIIKTIFMRWIEYEMLHKTTDISTEIGPNSEYTLHFQSVGETIFMGTPSRVRVTLYKGNDKIKSFDEKIYDDGKALREDNYSVEWQSDGVLITFYGEEQSDKVIKLSYEE